LPKDFSAPFSAPKKFPLLPTSPLLPSCHGRDSSNDSAKLSLIGEWN
jgi:hypothetical protein